MDRETKSTILVSIIGAMSAVVIAVITTYGTIAVSAPEAKRVKKELEEISDLKLIANLPIGTIVPSMLPPSKFAKAVGDLERTTIEWVLADGQKDITTSQYGQLSDKTKTPDLRGVFLRGMNEDGGRDPDDREPGEYQPDALQQHGHQTDARKHGWGKMGDTQGWTKQAGEAPPASVTNVVKITAVETRTADETRPKNVAVYFYIKIN
jgi:hypothetical protein